MSLTIDIAPRAFRDLKIFERRFAKDILDELDRLKDRPWPTAPKVKKLLGYRTLYRLRVGQYRITFEDLGAKVVVLRVVDRKDLEKTLKNL